MLGYPARVLLRTVETEGGQPALARVKQLAGLAADQTYRMNQDYAPGEIAKLLVAVGEVLDLTPDRVEDLWGDAFFPDVVRRWPMWFKTSRTARELLELQPEIHNSFAKASADPRAGKSVGEKFRLEKRERETVVHYRSPHRLCRFYIATAHRVIAHYGETATFREPQCQRQGDPECEIHIQWE